MRRRSFLFLGILALLTAGLAADEFKFPLKSGSVRFAAIGDMGTGEALQYEVAQQMLKAHEAFPFDFVIMLGDNIYGGSKPADFDKNFAVPYKPLLDAGVKFYASLGNHDNTNERFYKPFNMNGESYYTYKKGNVRFFVLNSNYMDPKQLAWLETQLKDAGNGDWKICYFHHPLYSSGKYHGPSLDLRKLLEPLFIKYGVDVVFCRPRPRLRAHSPAAGDLLLHGRGFGRVASWRPLPYHDYRKGIRYRPLICADRNRR